MAASGQSNLADKRLAATKSSKFGFRTHTLQFDQWRSLPFCLSIFIVQCPECFTYCVHRTLASFLPNVCRAILFAMGFHRMIVRGKQAPASEAPVVVIAPHSSFLDVLILCILRPCPSGISRSDNLSNPFIGGT